MGLSPRVNLNQHLNLVAVDFIGGDGAEGSIPCLEDDDRDHERGGERGGEGVSIFAGHLYGTCLGGGGPSPARQAPDVSDRICTHPRAIRPLNAEGGTRA